MSSSIMPCHICLDERCHVRRAVECWEMESRLKVHASARFPLFEPLMWHTVAHYHRALLPAADKPGLCAALTAWELSGLAHVLAFLKKQMGRSASFVCPESIDNPEGMPAHSLKLPISRPPSSLRNERPPRTWSDFHSCPLPTQDAVSTCTLPGE